MVPLISKHCEGSSGGGVGMVVESHNWMFFLQRDGVDARKDGSPTVNSFLPTDLALWDSMEISSQGGECTQESASFLSSY